MTAAGSSPYYLCRFWGTSRSSGTWRKVIEEALSTKLFQLKDIRVTSTEAAAKVDQKQSFLKIGEALGANMVVQGTLQGSGDKIRIILKLEDVADGKQLWSQQFDGVTGDLFTLEDEIYNPLVSALNLNPTNEELAKAEARPTENVAAYDLYLRGRNALRGHDAKSIQSALDFFDQALKNDRTFALAYARHRRRESADVRSQEGQPLDAKGACCGPASATAER